MDKLTIAQIALVLISSALIVGVEFLYDKGKINNAVRYVVTAFIFLAVGALSVILPLHKYGVL